MTTGTLATNITALGTVLQDYFQVLIANFWPILLGIGILVAVVALVLAGINKIFRHNV